MRHLFISYSRANRGDVDELVRRLPGLGYQAWMDSSLHGGQTWWDEILHQIRDCDAFVAVVSRDSLNSVACQRELEWALALGKPVLPVAVEHLIQALPRELSARQIVDYSQPGVEAAFALAGALAALPPASAPPEALPDPPAAPLSYLSDLADQIGNSEPLTHDQQRDIVIKLQPGLGSADPEEQQGAQYLLDRFSKRDDLYADIYRMLGLLGVADQDSALPTNPAIQIRTTQETTDSPTADISPAQIESTQPQKADEHEQTTPFVEDMGARPDIPVSQRPLCSPPEPESGLPSDYGNVKRDQPAAAGSATTGRPPTVTAAAVSACVLALVQVIGAVRTNKWSVDYLHHYPPPMALVFGYFLRMPPAASAVAYAVTAAILMWGGISALRGKRRLLFFTALTIAVLTTAGWLLTGLNGKVGEAPQLAATIVPAVAIVTLLQTHSSKKFFSRPQ